MFYPFLCQDKSLFDNLSQFNNIVLTVNIPWGIFRGIITTFSHCVIRLLPEFFMSDLGDEIFVTDSGVKQFDTVVRIDGGL